MRLFRRFVVRRPRPAPNLSFDERHEQIRKCPHCGNDYTFVTGFLLRDGSAYAVYYASVGGHPDDPLVAMDVVFATWGEDSAKDHVTFSCHYRPNGAGAVDAPTALSQPGELMGEQLTRKKALRHTRIDDFWDVADFICLHDPAVGAELRVPTEADGPGR